MGYDGMKRCCCSDAPRITCRTTSATVGDSNAAIVCRVLCKPPASSVFWQIVDDDTTTRLADGEHDQLYWATVSVSDDSTARFKLSY